MRFPRRRTRFGAVKVKGCPICSFTHDSKMEAQRCAYLDMMRRLKDITHLDVHPTITLAPGIHWKLDFFYVDSQGRRYYEDVKGAITPDFKLKLQMFKNMGHPDGLLIVKGKWRHGFYSYWECLERIEPNERRY